MCECSKGCGNANILYYFQILNAGHSRVPVHEKSSGKIVGILLVKSIIKLSPKDSTPVHTQMNSDGFLTFQQSEPLYNILNAFQTGKSKWKFGFCLLITILEITWDYAMIVVISFIFVWLLIVYFLSQRSHVYCQ